MNPGYSQPSGAVPAAPAGSAGRGPTLEDPEVLQALEEYLAALEAGQRPDRRTFLDRHPAVAGPLAECLDGLEILYGPEPPAGPVGPAEDLPRTGLLGDFRIVREVGRGGMGVVYEAEQVSLARRVALKVLPFAAALDARALQRFRTEAQAAAGLHHSNIVPVYFVGQERGIHFYAMQFIEGRTLAALVRELRAEAGLGGKEEPPGPGREAVAADTRTRAGLSTEVTPGGKAYCRTAAGLVRQAAAALAYAHDRGVVHRDVKPGNLLLDDRGTVWVTDFGLAHLQHAEGSLTLSGDLVGTLRYMSPEQALAGRAAIDHRTDVYSLGATLYELLTLRPAFTATDRRDLLRQIAFEEPARPRRLNRAIPAELETVVLKALEKDAPDRYATAQELADDLGRFLEDRPIRARRPSWRQVAVKWARRHRPVVAAAAAVLLVAALLGGASWLWWAQKRAGAEAEARTALEEVDRLRKAERWPEALSAVRRARGVLADVGADPELWQKAGDLERDLEMVCRLQEARLQSAALKDEHFDWEASDAAYAEAFRWYGLDPDGLDPAAAGASLRARPLRAELAAALDEWAHLRRIGRLPSWQPLVAIARAADPDPDRDRLRDALEGKQLLTPDRLPARADALPPVTAVLLTRLSAGTPATGRALELLLQVRRHHPADFWVNHELGQALARTQPRRLDEAIRYATAAVALQPQSPGARLNLGYLLQQQNRHAEAIAEFREIIRVQRDYAMAYSNLSNSLRQTGRHGEALAAVREAIRLKKDFPEAHVALGLVLKDMGKSDEAEAAYQEAIRINRKYADAHNNLGVILTERAAVQKTEEAQQEFRKQAAARFREAAHLRPDWALIHFNLGQILWRLGSTVNDRALRDFTARNRRTLLEEADRLKAEGLAELQMAVGLQDNFPEAKLVLGHAYRHLGRLDEAVAAYRASIRLNPNEPRAFYGLGAALNRKGQVEEAIAAFREAVRVNKGFADGYNDLGLALRRLGRLDEAVAAFRESIRANGQYVGAHLNLAIALEEQGQFREAVQVLRRAHEVARKQPSWSGQTAYLLREAEDMVQLEGRLGAVLEGKSRPKNPAESLRFAYICQRGRHCYAAATRFYAEALTVSQLAGTRYLAACAAVRAAAGHGQDAADLDAAERVRLRRQALAWLRADLDMWRRLREEQPGGNGLYAGVALRNLRADPDLAGVRDEAALAWLPAAEQAAWRQFWADVAATLSRGPGPKRTTNN